MATVIPLPPRPGAAFSAIYAGAILPRIDATGGRGGEYALADVARRLGMLHFGARTIVDKLRVLADRDGMPLPRTPRIASGKPVHGPLVIYSKSRWDAGEFDAWIDGRGPTGGGAPVARPLAAPVRNEMAGRAAQIAQAF